VRSSRWALKRRFIVGYLARATQQCSHTLSQLQTFLVIARARNFSGAARRGAARELGVSVSAVSQAVKQLEAQLRVVLLTRRTRSVLPTDAGRRLVDSAGPGMKLTLRDLRSEAWAHPERASSC
jgi:DNA-binding transcriptional LysR family regulator